MAKKSKYAVEPSQESGNDDVSDGNADAEMANGNGSSPASAPSPLDRPLPKLYAAHEADVVTTQSPPIRNPRMAVGFKETKVERELRRASAKRIADVTRAIKGIEWSEDQLRLTYLISLYSHWSTGPHERERAIRRMPLLVFVFEGIIAQVFDYDYAPTNETVGTQRVWINVSQEARDDMDDLMEFGLIKGYRLSSEGGVTETAYQVAPRGQDAIKDLSAHGRSLVEQLCTDPQDADRGLLEVNWRSAEGAFELTNASGQYRRGSAVTEAEDVSYVSSPYIPSVLRAPYAPALTSYAARAGEAGKGQSSLRDELAEVLHLSDVRCLLGEWIPFGANHILALNEKLGAGERVQGGLFSALVDRDVAGTQAEVTPGLTSVRVLDTTPTRHVNIEATIDYPEAAGIIQIENFGVSVRESGEIFYGVHVDAVMDRVKEKVSIDLLSRLLVDVQQDSSQLIDNLLSSYQRSVLEIVYLGSALQRSKVSVVIAEAISPRMLAEKYLDREDNENELKQILGDTHSAHNLSSDEMVIIGERALLLVGKEATRHEKVIVPYLGWWAMDHFLRVFFKRLFHLNQLLHAARDDLDGYQDNPSVIDSVRAKLRGAARDTIGMEETLSCLQDTLKRAPLPPTGADDAQRMLLDVLDVARLREDLGWRVEDLTRHVKGARALLEELTSQTMVVQETLLAKVQSAIHENRDALEGIYESGERVSGGVRALGPLLAGLLAFACLDRLLPRWWDMLSSGEAPPAWAKDSLGVVMELPAVWFVLSLLAWVAAASLTSRFARYVSTRATGGLVLRVNVDLPISATALRLLLQDKPIESEITELSPNGNFKRVTWTETDKQKWYGTQPKIELLYDEKRGALVGAKIQAVRGWRRKDEVVRVSQLRRTLFKELEEASVIIAEKR